MRMAPRVAFLPDSFHEINGVAHTSRNFVAYAARNELPFLCICAAERGDALSQQGEVQMLELKRSGLAVRLEEDLQFDPVFFRYGALIESTLRAFRPDVIHITGPSELGIFGAYFARKLGVPLAASWHTNVHEYAVRRMEWLTRRLGDPGGALERGIEAGALDATTRFYRFAKTLYAPNPRLCAMLEEKTGWPCYLMQRGVETELFTPARRTRPPADGRIVLGFVGRLSAEKNVILLPRIDAELRARGMVVEWLIVGHGNEEAMLRRGLPDATYTGVLRGGALAEACADMDLLIFPSHTDTFGNVVLEALASGVPAVVTPDGGPATIVRDGETGRITGDDQFADVIVDMLADPERFAAMRSAARTYALGCSWDAVFDRVYEGYPVTASVV